MLIVVLYRQSLLSRLSSKGTVDGGNASLTRVIGTESYCTAQWKPAIRIQTSNNTLNGPGLPQSSAYSSSSTDPHVKEAS